MSRETSRGRRPFKVWDCHRSSRKALVVSSLEELIVRGREKLGISGHESVRAVLESDGTQVDDSEYFRSLTDNTVFLLLRPAERWCPAGVDVIRAALSSIPRIVCEAISSLDLQNEVPAWKIMESRGRITIVLTWDHRPPPPGASSTTTTTTSTSHHAPPLSTTHNFDAFARHISPISLSPSPQSLRGSVSPQPPVLIPQPSHQLQTGWPIPPGSRFTSTSMPTAVRTIVTKDGKLETIINGRGGVVTPSITVISHEESPYDSVPMSSRQGLGQPSGRLSSSVPPPLPPHQHISGSTATTSTSTTAYPVPPPRPLPRQGSSSLESTASGTVHVHTAECTTRGHLPPHPPHGHGGRGSPPEPYCDFHCCALHEEGRKIQAHHSTVATSPIDQYGMEAAAVILGRHHQQQQQQGGSAPPPPSPVPGTSAAAAAAAAAAAGGRPLHVRFMGIGEDKNGRNIYVAKRIVPSSFLGIPPPHSSITTTTTAFVQHHPPPPAFTVGRSSITTGTTTFPSSSGSGGAGGGLDSTTTESSESETENNSSTLIDPDSKLISCRYLLLTDSLSLDQKRHLTIKDIGIILERLSSKIIDVEKLERECENREVHNWTIKASIRGEPLRELGVIYNGNYYSISEHPRYSTPSQQQQSPAPHPPIPSTSTSRTHPQQLQSSITSSHSRHTQPTTQLRQQHEDSEEDMRL